MLFDRTIDFLKALAEPTRLRLVRLLAATDLTVSDLVEICGQSQPRISRHLKLLVEAGVLERYQEGAFAYFRLGSDPQGRAFASAALQLLSPCEASLLRDDERLEGVRRRRSERAAAYFAQNAGRWDRIRAMQVPEQEVEAALVAALGAEPAATLLDVGTGTGRILELLGGRVERAVGIDASREMLAVARAKLDGAGLPHVGVRQGDAYHLPFEAGGFDLVTLHQVLHYLDDPAAAIAEAAGSLAPGGRLAIVDFAPHHHEFLREEHAHLRLGFSPETVAAYVADAGLTQEAATILEPTDGSAPGLSVTITIARKPGARPAMARSA